METELPRLTDLLGRLPWFDDLSDRHRSEMLTEVAARLIADESDDDFRSVLQQWEHVAHVDAKWTRFGLLKHGGLLEPPGHA
jgi:hypothetical protein